MSTEKKQVNTKTLLKSGFWYTVSNFLTRAMVFLTTPFFTRLMTKREFADFSVFANWQAILLIICGLETYATINRARFDYKDEDELNSYITTCIVTSMGMTALLFVFYLLFSDFVLALFKLDEKYVYIMFIYLLTHPAFLMFQAKQRVQYNYRLTAVLSFALVIISAGASVYLVHTMAADRLMGRVMGQYVPAIIAGFVFIVYFFMQSMKFDKNKVSYALRLGLPLVFSYLGSQVLMASDKFVVQHLCFDDEYAYLVLAQTVSHIMLIFVQSLNNAWAPWFFDKLKSEQYREIRKTFRIYMWFIIVCTFCALIITPELIAILGGKSYAGSIAVMPANMLCGVFTALTAQFVNIETYHKKTQYAGIFTSLVAVINVIFDIICVRQWGYTAACYVTVACQILLITLHMTTAKRISGHDLVPVSDLAKELGASLLLIPFMFLLYRFAFVRYGLIALIGAAVIFIALFRGKKILRTVKNYLKH